MPGKDDKKKPSNANQANQKGQQQGGNKANPVGFNDTTKGGDKGGKGAKGGSNKK